MPASEQIDGVYLSTYGLSLARLDGNIDLPAFKNILDEHSFESNLLKLDESTIKIRLIGFYASKAALGTALNNFYAKIRSAVKLDWIFSNHFVNASCVVKDGIQCNIYGTAVELVITLRVSG